MPQVSSNTPTVSFEFFPPKTPELEQQLWENIKALAPLGPQFVSVTYGAGGSTRDRTHRLVRRIREETSLEPAAHLTCIRASRDEIREIAEDYWKHGIRHIVALRGDMPQGDAAYQPQADGYAYADTLVAGLREIADFEISVAAYPETHPEALSPEADMEHLKRKLDAGATRAITQYFFDTDVYFRFVERARKAGITADITPGILPIGNYAQMVRFSGMCGTNVPDWVHERFAGLNDPEEVAKHAIDNANAQCDALQQGGVNQFHFYTLNRADLVSAVCARLGITQKEKAYADID
jgi:methylenetetrahydrofolate reductase (NADPH)